MTAVTLDQIIRGNRPFRASPIRVDAIATRVAPRAQKRLDSLPSSLDAVSALEQDIVADHAVIDQRLVSGAGRDLEVIFVPKPHLHAVNHDLWSRHLGVELQRHALCRLDSDDKIIWR